MISRGNMRRQLRASGGITNARQGYGIGSWVKERVRKIIPNELADVAVKAAPFVAPFFPGAAAAMRGIGRFDQRGSIGDAVRQAGATYAFGKGARYLGGLEGGTTGNQYSMANLRGGPIGNFIPGGQEQSLPKPPGTLPTTPPPVGLKKVSEATSIFKNIPILNELPSLAQQQILIGGVTSAGTYVYEKFLKEEPPQDESETMEEYMARRKENVGGKMRNYFDSYFTFDKNYSAMTDEQKDAEVARYNKNQGGLMRQNYQTGGISMTNTMAQNRAINNARRSENQERFSQAGRGLLNRMQAAKLANSGLTTLYSGTTSAKPFSGSKFFATPDLATAKTYATSSPLRGSPLSGPVTGQILQADVPTSQAQNLLKKGLTGTREVVLDPQAAKTLFETGQGALKGSTSLGTKAALAASKALPVAGGALSLADAALRLKQGDYVGAGLGAAAAVPGIGLPALGTQIVYDAAKNNPTIQKVGTSIGEGLYDAVQSGEDSTGLEDYLEGTEAATPTYDPRSAGAIITDGDSKYKINADGSRTLIGKIGEATPTPDASGYNFDSEYYRNNPDPFDKDYDRFTAAYAKATGGGKTTVSSDGKVSTSFGNYDPGNTYGYYTRNQNQAGPDHGDFYSMFGDDDKTKMKSIMESMYGAPGMLDPRDRPGYTNTGFTPALMASGGRVGQNMGGLMRSGYAMGTPLPNDPTKPINPFGPKPTGPVLPGNDKMADATISPLMGRIMELMMNEKLTYGKAKEQAESEQRQQPYIDERMGMGPGPMLEAAKGGLMRLNYMIGGEAKQMEAGAPPIMYSGNMDPNAQAGLPSTPGPMQMAEDGPEFDMRENGGFQPLGRQEGKDDVPAMLAKNEFVMTADAVRAAGGGSIQKGAQKMYDTMKKLESRVS